MARLKTPQTLSRWLKSPKHQIADYYRKAEQLVKLNHRWKQQKDSPIVLHSQIANVEHGILKIAVESSEWASRLHYEKLELLRRLKGWAGLEQLVAIKWYVERPHVPKKARIAPSKKLMLSEENKVLIRSVAGGLSSPSLQAALYKLTER